MPYKLLLVLCFCVGVSQRSLSQVDSIVSKTDRAPGSHYISAGFAILSADYLMDGYKPGRPTTYDYANKGFPGALFLSWKYKLSRRCYIGLTEVIEQEQGDWLDNEIPDGNVFNLQTSVKGAFVRTCYTTAADFTFDYAMADFYRLYLSTGAGVTYEVETDQYTPDFYEKGYYNGVNTFGPMRQHNNKVHPNIYFAPLGLSVGRKLCYFVELGFGYKGIVNTGFTCRF